MQALCIKVVSKDRRKLIVRKLNKLKGVQMKRKLLPAAIALAFLSGCASVPMESEENSNFAKQFNSPSPDTAGIYVYRSNTAVGAALKKDVWIDKECIGETAKGVFFYHEVEGDKDHAISTESEFSPNDLIIKTETGELYFVEQFIKMGVFVGGAGVEQRDKETGKKVVSNLKLAKKGACSAPRTSEE